MENNSEKKQKEDLLVIMFPYDLLDTREDVRRNGKGERSLKREIRLSLHNALVEKQYSGYLEEISNLIENNTHPIIVTTYDVNNNIEYILNKHHKNTDNLEVIPLAPGEKSNKSLINKIKEYANDSCIKLAGYAPAVDYLKDVFKSSSDLIDEGPTYRVLRRGRITTRI